MGMGLTIMAKSIRQNGKLLMRSSVKGESAAPLVRLMLIVKESKTAFGAAGKASAPPSPSDAARKKRAVVAVKKREGGNIPRMQFARNLRGGLNVKAMRIAPVKNAAFGAAQKDSVPITLNHTRSSPQRWNALQV
jgi:hypothetical protein